MLLLAGVLRAIAAPPPENVNFMVGFLTTGFGSSSGCCENLHSAGVLGASARRVGTFIMRFLAFCKCSKPIDGRLGGGWWEAGGRLMGDLRLPRSLGGVYRSKIDD